MRAALAYPVSRNSAVSTAAVWLGIVSAVVVLSVPWWGSAGLMRWAVEAMCYLVLAQTWNLMAGYGGLMSVACRLSSASAAIRCLCSPSTWVCIRFLAIPLGGVVAAVVAVLTAPIVFRMRGGYFAIGTWVLAEVFRIAVPNTSALGGGSGQSLTVMARIDRSTREAGVYLIAASLLILASLAIDLPLRSRFRLALTALRDSEDAAESQGVDVKRLKLQVYTLSSFGSGLVGAIYFTSILRISPPAAFDTNWSVAAIFIVVIGGIGTIEGPIAGAAVFFALLWFLADYRHGRGGRRHHHVLAVRPLGLRARALGSAAAAAAAPPDSFKRGRQRQRLELAQKS